MIHTYVDVCTNNIYNICIVNMINLKMVSRVIDIKIVFLRFEGIEGFRFLPSGCVINTQLL